MFCRGYKDEDYHKFVTYWKGHDWEAVPEIILPITGVVCVNNADDYIFGGVWVYADQTSPIGWMEWMVTNPQNTNKESLKTVKLLVEEAALLSKILKLKFLMTSVNKKSLVKLYGKHNFKATDRDMINMMRII